MTVAPASGAAPGAGPAGDANRIVVAGRELTWAALPDLPLPSPAAVVVASGVDALAAVRRHAVDGTELLVVAATRLDDTLAADLRADGFTIVRTGPDAAAHPPTAPRAAEPRRLWLLTSGSTGRPKRIGHTLESLTTVRGPQRPGRGSARTRPARTRGGRWSRCR